MLSFPLITSTAMSYHLPENVSPGARPTIASFCKKGFGIVAIRHAKLPMRYALNIKTYFKNITGN